jgi:hypothetical protein
MASWVYTFDITTSSRGIASFLMGFLVIEITEPSIYLERQKGVSIVLSRVKPYLPMLFWNNYRHTVMDWLQQFIGSGGDDRTGRELFPFRGSPDAVETGESAGLAILKIYEEVRHGVV